MIRTIAFLFFILPTILFAQTEEQYLRRAEQAQEKNNYREAINYITKAIELDSFNALYYEMRGIIIAGLNVNNKQLEHVDIQSFKGALDDFNRALELEPENPDFYQSRGTLYLNFRKYQEALYDFEQQLKFVNYTSETVLAMAGKARAKFESKEFDASFKILEDALELDSSNIFVLNNLALQYLILEDFESARRYLNKALANNAEDRITLGNMGYVALKSGKFEQALKIFNLVIDRDPDIGLFYNNRGFIKFKFGQYEEALIDINHAIKLSPANSYAYKNRALIYLSTNQNKKACDDLHRAKSLGYTLDYDDEVINLLIENCLKVNQKIRDKE